MKTIIFIEHVEERTSKAGDPYYITHAITEDGEEIEYFGKDLNKGDQVEVFLHWGKIKGRKTPKKGQDE